MNSSVVHLMKLNGELFPERVNGSQLKLYIRDPSPVQ